MSSLDLFVKHGGKSYPYSLDTTKSVPHMREEIYDLTSVMPANQKILIKGMLKDDADLSKLGLKSGQTITLIGTAGSLPKAPVMPVTKFIEDMDESELAQAMKIPAGLQNLGNTCYMNSTIQVLGRIPELRTALTQYGEGLQSMNPDRRVVAGLRDVYDGLARSGTDYPPLIFWQMLRQFRPQFDQQERGHYAQQDAEECWTSIVAALKDSLGGQFVQKYMTGRLSTTAQSAEAPDEESTVREESFNNLTCGITANTNYLVNGLKDGFVQEIEKTSTSLGRNAIYTNTTSISRAPAYLSIHLNRFFWRADIRKKTKIMRKVKFPFDLDATELFTEELQQKMRPANRKLMETQKNRDERAKVAKRTKKDNDPLLKEDDSEETAKRKAEAEEIEQLVDPSLKQDEGASTTGLYELVGIVTHKGQSSDGGHYVGWCKNPDKPDSWFKYDDAVVTEVKEDAITALEGGGENHSAYLLLYRTKPFA